MTASDSDPILTLLADVDPVDAENLVTSENVTIAWSRLERKLLTTATEGSRAGRAWRHGRLSTLVNSRRAVALAAVVAASALAAAGVLAIPGVGPGTVSLLGAAAAIAAEQPAPNPGPGQYYHEEWGSWARTDLVKSDQNGLGVLNFQWYVRSDGSGESITSSHVSHGVRKARTVTQWNVDGPAHPPIRTVTRISDGTVVSETDFGPGQFNSVAFTAADTFQPEHPSELPIEPPALKRWLEHRLATNPPHLGASVWRGGPEAEALLPEIADLLENPTASSQLRSALFTVASEVPGITIHRHVKDVDGRIGEAIVTTADAGNYQQTSLDSTNEATHTRTVTGMGQGALFELILDPDTTQILATDYVDRGQVTEYKVLVSQGSSTRASEFRARGTLPPEPAIDGRSQRSRPMVDVAEVSERRCDERLACGWCRRRLRSSLCVIEARRQTTIGPVEDADGRAECVSARRCCLPAQHQLSSTIGGTLRGNRRRGCW